MFPSSVDMHSILGTRTFKAEITNNVVVEIDFDAKNGLGMELPYTAKCVYAPGEKGEITFIKR